MSVAAIGAAGITPFAPPVIPSPATTATPATGGGTLDFAAGLQQVEHLQQQADALGTQVATGSLADIHQFTATAAKANLAVELTVAVRNRAVEAYQEIMRMQV